MKKVTNLTIDHIKEGVVLNKDLLPRFTFEQHQNNAMDIRSYEVTDDMCTYDGLHYGPLYLMPAFKGTEAYGYAVCASVPVDEDYPDAYIDTPLAWVWDTKLTMGDGQPYFSKWFKKKLEELDKPLFK